jgi:hypothetical protein
MAFFKRGIPEALRDPWTPLRSAQDDRMAATTSSVLTVFMQRKSSGHSRRKQGLHST